MKTLTPSARGAPTGTGAAVALDGPRWTPFLPVAPDGPTPAWDLDGPVWFQLTASSERQQSPGRIDDAQLPVVLLVAALDHAARAGDRRPGDAAGQRGCDERARPLASKSRFLTVIGRTP